MNFGPNHLLLCNSAVSARSFIVEIVLHRRSKTFCILFILKPYNETLSITTKYNAAVYHVISALTILMHGNLSLTSAIVSLSRHNHIIMCSCLQPRLSPRLEMISNSHNTLTPLSLSHTEDLPKRCCSLDTRLIYAHLGTHKIQAPVRGEIADFLAFRWRSWFMVWMVVLNDVVFNQRTCGPAVDGEVGVALRLEATRPVYDSL